MASGRIAVTQINGKVGWKARQAKGGNWVAICDPLKLTLQAKTWADLMEDIALTLDAILKDLLTANELDQFLRDRGWTLVGPIPRHHASMRFDLPFSIAIVNRDGAERRLHQ